MFAASKTDRASAAGATDPYFPYVPLLLETTSTNGQQNNTFLDSSTNNFTITRNGTPTQGSVTPYWPDGQWSNYFSSASDGLTFAASAGFVLTGGAFTIEFWAYPTSGSNYDTIIDGGMGSGFGFTRRAGTNAIIWQAAGAQVEVGTNFLLNQWNHIVANYSGTGSVNLYINGTSVSSAGSVPTNTGTIALYVGKYSAGQPFAGYVSNVRIVKGSAVYTNGSTITVPTTPLTSVTNTQLLTCQANRFIDSNTQVAAKTLTVTGTPKVQEFQPFSPAASYTAAAYGGSGYFNGSTNSLSIASNAALNLTGDFTVETWAFATATTNAADQVFNYGNFAFSLYHIGTTWTVEVGNGSSNYFSLSGTASLNSWHHFAITRSTNTYTFWIDGVSASTTTNANAPTTSGVTLYISRRSSVNDQWFTGYISNFRIVKGTAVYTAAFTPPTAPVTAITNTSLLLNYTNAGIYDAAVQNDVVTVGDAQASTTVSKWSPTSMKFDGTGDWLTVVDGPQLQLGTGDFTIDGWVYLSATGVAYGIISKGTASTGWSVNVTSGNKLQFSYTASNLTGATSLAATTWYYFAVVRSGSATGNLKVYLNGAVDATSGGAVTDNFNQTNILYVGADRIGTSPLNGYLQDVRITKAARTITTPTAAFPTR